MHQGLFRIGDIDQRVAGGRHLAEPRADDDQQVRIADGSRQLRIEANAGMPGVTAVAVVDVVLEPERGCNRHIEALGESLDLLLDLFAPAGTADHK